MILHVWYRTVTDFRLFQFRQAIMQAEKPKDKQNMNEEPKGEVVAMGQAVKVVDEYSVVHDGLVTNQWGAKGRSTCINVAWVSKDVRKRDDYGQQKEHLSSCSHASQQDAPLVGTGTWTRSTHAIPSTADSSPTRTACRPSRPTKHSGPS